MANGVPKNVIIFAWRHDQPLRSRRHGAQGRNREATTAAVTPAAVAAHSHSAGPSATVRWQACYRLAVPPCAILMHRHCEDEGVYDRSREEHSNHHARPPTVEGRLASATKRHRAGNSIV